jgi:hypothetical protein
VLLERVTVQHNRPMGISTERADIYAAGTAVLEQDKEVANAEGIFAQALTNGLLAIAAVCVPGHPASSATSVSLPPASKLLDDFVDAFGQTHGVCSVPTGEDAVDLKGFRFASLGYELRVEIQVDVLRDALRRSNAPRHGRGAAGVLTDEDVRALGQLDDHPALRVLSGQYADSGWRQGQVEDLNEHARASDYLALLDESEQERRRNELPVPLVKPGDDPGVPPQSCPVCGWETLISTGGDEMGYGITAGVCFICSYRLSEATAHEMNLDAEWVARWESL